MQTEEVKDWIPNPGPQLEVLRRTEDEILYGGARGGGKTEAGQVWLVDPYYLKHPRYRFLVIRRNSGDLSDWLDRAQRMFASYGAKFTGNPPEIHFPSGAIGRTGHLKDKDAYTKYLGHEYHKILIEELTLIPSQENYTKLISCARSTIPELKPQVMGTTNPGGPGHVWVKQRWVENGPFNPYFDPKEKKWRIYIPSKATDTPQLGQEYHNFLDGLTDKLRKAWRDGDWDVFDGQFFDEWSRELHVCEPFEIPAHWKRYIGVDYGYSNPSAVVWFAVSEYGITYAYRELYAPKLTFELLRDLIIDLSCINKAENLYEPIEYAAVDSAVNAPSQGTGIHGLEVLNKQDKIKFITSDKARVLGWARFREYLRPRTDFAGNRYALLKIFSSCKQIIRTLPSLVHRDSGDVEDMLKDGSEDHLADAMRYFFMSRPAPADPIFNDPVLELDANSRNFWLAQRRLREESNNPGNKAQKMLGW